MGRGEFALLLDRLDHLYLLAVEELIPQPERQRLEVLVVVQVAVGFAVGGTVEDKFQQGGNHRLAALGNEEVLQMIVRQRRILDVNFADNTHLDLGLFAAGDRREVLEDLGVGLFRREELVALEQLGQLLLPCVQHLLGLASFSS